MTGVTDGTGADPGGQPSELSVRLSVPEMDRPSCAGTVKKSRSRVDGVLETDLQPTTGTATVTYDGDRVSRADLVAAIQGTGYEVVSA